MLAYTNVSEERTASIFRTEDGDSMSLRNVRMYLQLHMVLHD
jgi:hypothetical protein